MTFKRYFEEPELSSPQRALRFLSRWPGRALFVALLCVLSWGGWFGCGGPPCVPACGNGYTCYYGQCQLDPVDGREKAITCQAYCDQLTACNRTTSAACVASQCRPLTQYDAADRQFRLSLYECHLAATCQDIADYLEFQRGFLQSCIGCSRDSHCPGGFRCDTTQGLCRNACTGPAECRESYQCINQRCVAQSP